jgi:hypothetical protein
VRFGRLKSFGCVEAPIHSGADDIFGAVPRCRVGEVHELVVDKSIELEADVAGGRDGRRTQFLSRGASDGIERARARERERARERKRM